MSIAGPADFGALGAWVTYRLGWKSKPYIIVGQAGPASYRMVGMDGALIEVPFLKVADYWQPVTGSWTLPGALLQAARGSDVSAEAREVLTEQALGMATDLPTSRGLLIDAVRLRRDDVANQLRFGPTESVWWRAIADFSREEIRSAAEALLALRSGTYPGRIVVWFAAARRKVLDGRLLDGVMAELDQLCGLGPVFEVAALMTREAVAGGSASEHKQLLEAARACCTRGVDAATWKTKTSDGALARSGTAAGRILGARKGEADLLVDDRSAVERLPRSILDDIIDAGGIPNEWVESQDELPASLLARLAPEHLSDAQLREFGLHEERARRAALSGDPEPDDLSSNASRLFRLWRLLSVDGSPDRVGELAHLWRDVDEVIAEQLRGLLSRPGEVPPDELLREPVLRAALLRNWKVRWDDYQPATLSDEQADFAAVQILFSAKRELYAWRWEEALAIARNALRFGRSEPVRDEALNLIACAQWELGNDDAAIQALRSALDGMYTESLQTNIAVVAAELEPATAGEHLAKIVSEAPNLSLRLSAARRAVQVWSHSTAPWEDEDEWELPSSLASALRSLVLEDLPHEDFLEIVRLLADHDAEWLSRSGALRSSPHRDSLAARLWVAKAKGFSEFVPVLARALRDQPPDWVRAERDRLVNLVKQVLIVEDPPTGAVLFAMEVLDHNLPMDRADLAVIRAFTARGAAMLIDPEEGEPSDKFLDWLEAARSDLDKIPAELRSNATQAVEWGFSALAGAYLQSRWGQLQQAAELYDNVVDRLRFTPQYQIDWHGVRSVLAPVVSFCDDTQRLFRRLRPNVNADLGEVIDSLTSNVSQLRQHTLKLSS